MSIKINKSHILYVKMKLEYCLFFIVYFPKMCIFSMIIEILKCSRCLCEGSTLDIYKWVSLLLCNICRNGRCSLGEGIQPLRWWISGHICLHVQMVHFRLEIGMLLKLYYTCLSISINFNLLTTYQTWHTHVST